VRLARLDHGHTLPQKLLLRFIRWMISSPVPDVVKTLMYRKKYFGDPQSRLTERVMRGPSAWSVGERELFAAFVSSLNQCAF